MGLNQISMNPSGSHFSFNSPSGFNTSDARAGKLSLFFQPTTFMADPNLSSFIWSVADLLLAVES
jgi:hypothetical protein